MNLENTQPNQEFPQERNISLERQEIIKRHNEILAEFDALSDDEKKKEGVWFKNPEAQRMADEMDDLRKEADAIKEYRELAKPKSDSLENKKNDTEISPEDLPKEQEMSQKEVKSLEYSISTETEKLNKLREVLGMPPTEDIPSLVDKREKLSKALEIQEELRNRVNIENKKEIAKNEESNQSLKREGRNLNDGLEVIGNDMGNFSKILEDRQSQGFSQIFQNSEVFRTLASQTPDTSNSEDIKNYFSSMKTAIDGLQGKWSLNDKPESLDDSAKALRQLSNNIQEFTSKIQNGEQRKEIALLASSLIGSVDRASSVLTNKARDFDSYLNTRI